jgi:hypothetical protein
MAFAGCCVLYADHITGSESSGLPVCRDERHHPLQHRYELDRWTRVIETILKILGAPTRLECSEEGAGGGNAAANGSGVPVARS